MANEVHLSDMVQHAKDGLIKKETLKLARLIDTTGLQEHYTLLQFEHEVSWLRTTETQYVLRDRAGEKINEGAQYNDYYGLLTSLNEVLPVAKSRASNLKLTPDSDLVIETITTIKDRPVVTPSKHLIRRSSTSIYSSGIWYLHAPDDWMFDDEKAQERLDHWNTPEPDPAVPWKFVEVNRLKAVETELVVWSSRNTEEQNAAALAVLDQYRL